MNNECNKCEARCDDNHLMYEKIISNDKLEWMVLCVATNRWQNPITGKFNLSRTDLKRYYRKLAAHNCLSEFESD